MVYADIENIKKQYTDKYVVVDAEQPELARFRDVVGQVKTVNMSGRALVEFMDYHLNTGWYDIDLDYLKVVDKPKPVEKKPAAKPAAKKPAAAKQTAGAAAEAPAAAGEKKPSPLELARMQGAAGKGGGADKPAPSGKPSTADILAAARGDKSAGSAPAAKPKPQPSASTTTAEAPQQKVDRSKMSVADMLAAARGGSAAKSAPQSAASDAEAPPEEPVAEAPPAEEAAPPAETSATEPAGGPVDKSSMSVDEIIAYCREHDAS